MSNRMGKANLVPVAVIGGTFVLMAGYEWLKQWIFPGISIWRSHTATIILVTALVAIASWVADRIQRSNRKELAKSEARFKGMYEGTSEAVMLLDEKGFFDCNPKTLEMFGFEKKEDFCRVHPADISPPRQPDGKSSFPAAQERIRIAFQSGSNRFEWIHCRVNGEDFPAEVVLSSLILDGRKVLQATVRDITLRRKVEEALAESEKTFKRMFEITSEGVALIDPATGRFIAANPAACKLFGYAEGEFAGLTPEDLTPPEAKEIMRKAMKALSDGTNVGEHEGVSLKKDGTRINVIVNNSQLTWKGKTVFFTTFKDVTFLKDMQTQLEKKNRDIVEFADSVAHDLKKPLTSLKIIFGLMGKMAVEKTCAMHWDIHGTAEEAVKNMQELLDDLLLSAKLEHSGLPLEKEEVEVEPLIAQIVQQLKPQIEAKSIRIRVSAHVRVPAERKSFAKIFSNLIGNAVNYIGEKQDRVLEIACVRREKEYEFFVRDNGIGIPEADQARIFQKFIRGSNTAGISGTGLGLPIVKAAVEAHGGRVWVESAVGKGTTFYFTLPTHPPAPLS